MFSFNEGLKTYGNWWEKGNLFWGTPPEYWMKLMEARSSGNSFLDLLMSFRAETLTKMIGGLHRFLWYLPLALGVGFDCSMACMDL